MTNREIIAERNATIQKLAREMAALDFDHPHYIPLMDSLSKAISNCAAIIQFRATESLTTGKE